MNADDPSAAASYVGLSVRDAIARLTRALKAAGLEEPQRDARLLVLGALGLTGIDLLRTPERPVDAAGAARLAAFAQRRGAHEPVARILGERGFYGRVFSVTPATLDPRPCTETVIEAVLEVAREEGWLAPPVRLLDVGTGSGALLVTLLAEMEGASGVGTDISAAALDAAQANALRLGVSDRATFLIRSGLDDVAGPFDVLVSNPPYIPSGEIAGLAPDVRLFDPLSALDGGADGLRFYRMFAAEAARVVPRGWIFLEVGAGQAEAVLDLFRAGLSPPAQTRVWYDLGGHARCVAVKTQNYP